MPRSTAGKETVRRRWLCHDGSVRPTTLLLPSDPLRSTRPDDHFAPEAVAARELGVTVRLVDHDAVAAGEIDRAARDLVGLGSCVYRGWMIPPNRYHELDEALANAGTHLRTSPTGYEHAHRLPHWYASVERWTPASAWTTSPSLDEFDELLAGFGSGPAVIRDYSKSEKHYWDEAMFIPDVTDRGRARQVAERLAELRGDFFDTGFVIRRFERFQPAEWRSWWVDGECRMISAHPDSPDISPPPDLDLTALAPDIATLELTFASVDVTRSKDDDSLRIIEVGDGQVSDRPSTTDPTTFLAAILGG